MFIAIVGTGLAGLATGWHLLCLGHKVTFFDEKGIGQGVSGMAAGLMNPYVGEKARRSWHACEGLAHTEELLAVSQVSTKRGIIRLTESEVQRKMLQKGSQRYGDVEAIGAHTFLLHAGQTIDVPLYLQGLFRACQNLSCDYVQKKVSLDEAVPGFDRTIFACGKEWLNSRFAQDVKATKGQVLQLRSAAAVGNSIVGKGYVAVTSDPHTVYLGSTYEREFTHEDPDIALARAELMPRLASLLPCEVEIIGCKAGVRLVRKGSYIPFVERLDEQCWWIGALGSRGLLYHAYLGKKLAEALSANSPMLLPKEVQRTTR